MKRFPLLRRGFPRAHFLRDTRLTPYRVYRRFILYQYYQCHITQPLILEQLLEWGVQISSGELSHLLIENKELFHREEDALLTAGFQVSGYINVDDTGARPDGKNGYCTHIGNEFFAWFESTNR